MGRGMLYQLVSNVILLASSYAIHIGLGRYLGIEEYGSFVVIFALMSTVGLILASGLTDATSKYIAEDNAVLGSIVQHSRKIQLILSTLLFTIYFLSAGAIADLLNDPGLTPYIRISAFVIPVYALYYVYYSYLNGLKLFLKQAKTLAAVSLARVVLTFILVSPILFGLGIKGAIIGYISAALIGLILAWTYLRKLDKGSKDFEWKNLIRFSIPATLFAVMLFILMNADLLFIKALIDEGVDTGYYAAATTMAKAPYFIFAGLALAVLPHISSSTSRNDFQLAASYIKQSMRSMLMLLVPGVLLISATSHDLVSLFYTTRYNEAGNPLSVLVFGLASLCIFLVLSYVIMGAGKPNIAFGIALISVIIDITLNVLLIPNYGLMGAAWATTTASMIGMIIAAAYVFRYFKALVRVKSLIKICLSSLVIYVIALQFSLSTFLLPTIYIGLYALYFLLLLLMKEFSKEDLRAIKKIIPIARFRETSE